MAQKTQNVSHPEDRSNPPSRTSSAKDGAGGPSSTRHSAASGSASASGSISTILPRMSDPNPISVSSSTTHESPQPMDKSASAGSHAASSEDASGGTASPYGTRSRKRNGGSRINYAEDKDIDMELFEMYPERGLTANPRHAASSNASSSAGATATATAITTAAVSATSAATKAVSPAPAPATTVAAAAQPAQRSGNGSGRKPLPSSDDSSRHHASHQHSSKEKEHQNHSHHPSPAASTTGTGASSTPNGSARSKKRKAEQIQASATTSSSQAPSVSHAHSSAVSKRIVANSSHGANGTRSGGGYSETNLLTFDNCKSRPKNGRMVADDGTVLEVNDHVYLVCEPPGEPYYLARIMEFLHVKNDNSLAIDALRVNWYYRPKDIGRKVQDTRMVFATMHSDISPLTALRGKCQIRHKAEISNLTDYKKAPDCFWYEKLYDRYIQKNYEVIPTAQIINVPEHVKRVLDERWRYILVEQGRGKELTSAVKTCKRCTGYCASNDSVDCAVCEHTYHMNCVKPPLLKKPSRGFAWSCAACSRAQERKLEARNTPNVDPNNHDADDDEYPDDEEDDGAGLDTGRTSRTSPADDDAHQPATAEQIYHASLWPYRYLGIHCKVEDALDYDDRIFPRASTRLGPRHQAVVLPWPGRPVQYVKPLEIKKSGRKDGKLNKEQQAALEAERIKREKRPKYVQDEPPGWVERGGDSTVTELFKPPERCGVSMSSDAMDEYMNKARKKVTSLKLPPRSTNLEDVARDVLYNNLFDPEKALKEMDSTPRSVFKEPELTPAEQKKFEEGVAKFGSELHSVMKHVKTLTPATVTRYYYTWKKTERGKVIWGNYPGRKGKKDAKKAEAAANKIADDVADDHDDSAFDTDKARDKKKEFICKFCSTKASRQWRRAPNASVTVVAESAGRNSNKDKGGQYIPALCRRCAELWRRYAIQWEDIEEVAKKVAQTGGRGWRRKVDEELYKELVAADEMMNNTRYLTPDPVVAASPASSLQAQATQEPPRKKLKGLPDKDPDLTASESGSVSGAPHSKKKEKAAEKQPKQQPAPPPPPAPVAAPLPPILMVPKPRTLPCAICHELEPLGDQHLSCKECRLAVHRSCYGIMENRAPGKWTCDMCLNDKSPQVSIHYKCVLCPVEFTEHDFVEPPKVSHKKKTEKERERDRIERDNAQKAADYYRKKQEEMNRPVNPREPLKRTADNNWVHVTCAVWTPEVKFGNTKALGPSEGIPSIPRARYAEMCKVCKKDGGACVHCYQCRTPIHVECAHQAGYVLGFDITPVKGSRRDQHNIVSINGDTGTMSAAIWCKDHAPTKTVVHHMHEVVDESGMNALQLYAQNFKQADLTLTGCARKANQITLASSRMSTSSGAAPASQQNRRSSNTNMVNGGFREPSPSALQPDGKICLTCGSDVSPKWHAIDQAQERELTNGYYGNLGTEAQKFVEQRSFQCHKCKKAGRKPNPHAPREPTPPPEPVRSTSPRIPSLRSPAGAEQRPRSIMWTPPGQLPGAPIVPVPPHPGVSGLPPGVQAPHVAPPPLPQTVVPRGPPVPTHPYATGSRTFTDWHRTPTGHGPAPVHEVNGGPPPPHSPMHPLAPPNHLRPQTMPAIGHGPPPHPPPTQNGQMAQPFVNGMPPSPRRVAGPPPPSPQNGGPYIPSHHSLGSAELRHHHMPMSQIPPVVPGPIAPEAQQSLYHLRQWNNHGPPPPHHSSPPLPRESIPLSREPSNPPPRDNRPASGASASPSLRNLLS
ncbi:hypothetical protein B0T26DRAFT_634916 [Lasiosphaeria miniovina]|uniref:Uncharacterized protein n=1 Tax=Lasiosphaeria miniovina TaxID=1954250 RepID=A0AA40E9L6_9PEZI|nr:uncharacterized protein B0T26DRAFT_634916 [Lasiosphaeria miniovina]KAK0733444.1 hypothetical protein B0T26DRAFT_634916 [Lasiosphaeria miniovina]